MSEDQNRGRRRPSREHHQSSSSRRHEYDDSGVKRESSDRRPRERDIVEEPRSKYYKVESGTRSSADDVASTSHAVGGNGGGDGPTTSSRASSVASGRGAGGSGGEGGSIKGRGDRPPGRRRDNYEIVHTRPENVQSKKGTTGQPIALQANYFRLLKKPNWSIYQYHVTFSPEIELRFVRGGLLSIHRELLGGFLYDGTKLFTTTKLPNEETILHSTSTKGNEFMITLKFVGIISMNEWQSLQVLNLILRRALEGLKLDLVGRNFFDSHAKIDIRDHKIQLWPGYQTSIRQNEQDILLCAEIAHKVMRNETAYDVYAECMSRARGNPHDVKDDYRRLMLGQVVLTDYNNKTHRVCDVDFSKTPEHKFMCKKDEISFVEYFRERYQKHIRDLKQPLLVIKSKDRNIRAGANETFVLVPELCRMTGLTDTMRNNFHFMRTISEYTRMVPERRISRLRAFNKRLQETPASMKILQDWNMQLDTQLVEIEGRVLDSQKIVFYDHRKILTGRDADWTRNFRDVGLFSTPSAGLHNWSVVFVKRNHREIREFIDALTRAAGGMKMNIYPPKYFQIFDDRNSSYVQAIEDCCRSDPQLILCLVTSNNAERYASIKKKSCVERAVPTQVITQRTVSNNRGLMSIATKVAIQINSKLGYTPWMVEVPLPGLMTVGFDIAKCARDKNKAFCALVASMDMKVNPTFYSTVAECNAHDMMANSLWVMMTKALRQYRKEHDSLPSRILFYRDGVGEGTLKQLYEHEVRDLVEKLENEYKRAGADKPPRLAYIVVTKSINTRFFARGQNPPPGTVIDDVVTQPERYDFYLVSQSVRQGTVSPTSYNVLYSNIRLSPDQLQQLTYKMTHLYYNWSGTTRVPAVCQYAKKLATLVATCLFYPPQNALEKRLFYL